jgi:hypothetical protein
MKWIANSVSEQYKKLHKIKRREINANIDLKFGKLVENHKSKNKCKIIIYKLQNINY